MNLVTLGALNGLKGTSIKVIRVGTGQYSGIERTLQNPKVLRNGQGGGWSKRGLQEARFGGHHWLRTTQIERAY